MVTEEALINGSYKLKQVWLHKKVYPFWLDGVCLFFFHNMNFHSEMSMYKCPCIAITSKHKNIPNCLYTSKTILKIQKWKKKFKKLLHHLRTDLFSGHCSKLELCTKKWNVHKVCWKTGQVSLYKYVTENHQKLSAHYKGKWFFFCWGRII